MKDKIFDKRIIALYVLVISSLVLGITYALSVVTSNVSLSSTTGQYGIDETVYGETKFSSDTLNLTPILDNDITTKTNNVIKIDFNVRGSSNNPTDKNIIYDIALNDLDVDCQLLSKDVKWKLVKNNTELSSGSLANSFDTIVDGRMVLTTIQEDLPSSSSTPDSYSFYLWISDACQKSDISQCTTEDEKRDQSYLLQKAISGKVEVELNTGEKKNLARTTSTDLDPDTCSNNQYRVVFDANGGTVSPQFVNKSSDLTTTTLPAPVRSNYTFDGWYIDEEFTTEVSNSDLQNTTTNTVLYAKWIPISKTLTLINNCTYPSNGNRTLTINYNSTYSELVPDLCLGNKFNGWFTAASGGSQINKSDRVKLTEDTSYYGQWSLNSYTLTYNLNGGTVSTANPSSYNIDTTTFNLNNPTKTGYTFTGWTEAIQSNIWYDGFIKNATQTDNSSVGIVHDNATYPKSVFSDLIYLKANNTYTLTPDTLGSVRWRVFKNVDGVLKYYGNGSSTKTYTPTEDCYVSIMFHLGENATNRNASKVTSNDKPTTLTIPKGSTGNRVYTANFSNNTYTISYTLNGGTAGTNAPTSGTYDTDVQISNPTKTVTLTGNENSTSGANGTGVKIGSATSKAQTFTGWTSSSSAGLGSNAKTGTASNPTTSWTGSSTKNTFFKNLRDTSGTVTLTANWTAVAFNLPTVTKDGYTCGWNTSSSGTTIQYASGASYTPSANSDDSINMYAVCLENQATVTINKNGSAWSSSGMNVALYSGTTVAYAYSEGTASGSTVSWSGVKAGTYNVYAGKRSDSETTLVDTGVDITVSNGTTSAGSGSATINYYVLTLNEGTGISSVTGAATYLSNQSASIGATATTGYAFSSWTVNSGNTPASTTTASTTVTITQATTLTANAAANTYTVTFNKTDGDAWTSTTCTGTGITFTSSTTACKKTVTYDSTYGTLPTPTRTGYTFDGWYTASSGGTLVSSTSTVSLTADQTLYAHWSAQTYTITYDANGGSGAPESQIKNYGVDLTLSTTIPTYSGYTFLGWSTNKDATSATYKAGGTYSVNESATLYAVWEKSKDINIVNISINGSSSDSLPTSGTYTMSYSCDGGSTLSWNTYSKTITYGSGAKVGDSCSVSFTSSTNYPLLNTMEVGSYVAYTGSGGTVGTTSVSCQTNGSDSSSTAADETEAPNSCTGQNAREDLDNSGYTYGYCYSNNYKYYTTGWRIAYINNNKAIIVSAGSPECNSRTGSTANVTYIQTANAKALKYCNTNYVDGNCTCTDSDGDGLCDSSSTDAWAINDTDFYYMTKAISGVGKRLTSGSSSLGDSGGALGTTLYCYGKSSYQECGYHNDLIDNGGYYWFAAQDSSSDRSGVNWNPSIRYVYRYTSTYAYGLRPVISLSSTVYVTGGSGTMDDPYTIAN